MVKFGFAKAWNFFPKIGKTVEAVGAMGAIDAVDAIDVYPAEGRGRAIDAIDVYPAEGRGRAVDAIDAIDVYPAEGRGRAVDAVDAVDVERSDILPGLTDGPASAGPVEFTGLLYGLFYRAGESPIAKHIRAMDAHMKHRPPRGEVQHP